MDSSFATFAMSTPTIVLDYAAAFFFVVVAIAAAYALFKPEGRSDAYGHRASATSTGKPFLS